MSNYQFTWTSLRSSLGSRDAKSAMNSLMAVSSWCREPPVITEWLSGICMSNFDVNWSDRNGRSLQNLG